MIGHTVAEFTPADEFAEHAAHRATAYSGEWVPDGQQERLHHVFRKGGGSVPMVAAVARDLDADGEWTGGLLIGLRDVTNLLAQQQVA